MIQIWVINMDDIFVYYKCVDGHCPLVVEEEIRIVKIVYIMKKIVRASEQNFLD